MAKKFRNRFRLPYPSYKDLLHQIKSDNRFERWRGHKWNGKKSSSVELLLLGSLRYLGRGSQGSRVKKKPAFLLFAKGFLAVVRIAKRYYFTPTTQPPPARNPNYQGSRCLTLTSGQPMYPNVGAKTLAATHTMRLQDPNPGPRSLQYTSYHYATTYLVRRF